MRITSVQNPTIKYVRSLDRTSVRRKERVFLAEGVRLVREALSTGLPARFVLTVPDLLRRTPEGAELLSAVDGWTAEHHETTEAVLRSVSDTETPSGVLAVLERPSEVHLSSLAEAPFGVLLDAIADPGNVGTIARTAAAVGAGYLIAMPGTVDPFAPKVVRAGMGAHFRLAILEASSWHEVRDGLPTTVLIACDMAGSRTIYTMAWPERWALVVGSEARGLTADARSVVDTTVRIPMISGVESLNAAVAAAIVMYEARGRRVEGS